MSFHAFGRDHLIAAWSDLFGRTPELNERQVVQAVALGEGGYGLASYKNQVTGESAVLNNWGATQCGHGPPCGGNCYEVTDHHGDGSAYQWCYHRFDTPEEGARSYLKILRQIVDRSDLGFQGALDTASTDAFVFSMKQGGYFELALEKYQDRVWKNANTIAQSLGEPLAVTKEEGFAAGADPLPTSLSLGPEATLRGAPCVTLSDADELYEPDDEPTTPNMRKP